MEKEFIELSALTRDKILAKVQKYPIKHTQTEVDMALKGLDFYHCTKQENIIKILQDQEIRVKRLAGTAQMTNAGSDIIQGFDNTISMSIGEPWYEYGNYCFVYGLEKISDDSLFFFKDPWQLGSKKLQESYLTKQDFTIVMNELLLRNLRLIRGKIFKRKLSKNLHKLIRKNCKRFEVKQVGNLSLMDADEFFFWSKTDYIVMAIARVVGHWSILFMLAVLVMLRFWLVLK
jgi:isocitrate dehydrogenase kinase/phosphatase